MKKYSIYLITILRIVMGWHFLYEGIVKILNPNWSSKFYLLGSDWIFSGLFHWIASNAIMLKIVDYINMWGLAVIGLLLLIGLFVRWASLSGAVLIFLYFIAYPPIPGFTMGVIAEGNYQWVDKNLIELFILIVISSLPSKFYYGIDRLYKRWKAEKPLLTVPAGTKKGEVIQSRRELIRDLIGIPFIGAFAYALYRKRKWESFEKKYLVASTDAKSGSTLKSFQYTSIEDLKGVIPKGKIANCNISRLIMGGNLIGGWSHARDLIYVDKLIKTYHSDEKVMLTLELAERCGINAIISNPQQCRIVNKYRHETDGKIQFISDCGAGKNFIEGIKISIDWGSDLLYSHGGQSDQRVYNNDPTFFDELAQGIELIRSNGKPAGVGAHRIETIMACVECGIKPDFWVKTIHSHDYWSAQVDLEKKDVPEPGWKDNNFCLKPHETIEFMDKLEQPWIAFKTLAAGAIRPEKGFRFAFNNGADFICVGMYDFQIVEDINIALNTLSELNRTRPWRG